METAMLEETDLARAFEDLVRDVEVRPGLKGNVERRIRQRRTRHRRRVAAGALVAVGSLVAIVPMLRDRTDGADQWITTDGRDGAQREGPGSDRGPVSVVLDGVYDGDRWQLEAYDSSDGLCVDLRYQGDGVGGCGLDEAQRAVGVVRGRRGGVEAVFGTARLDVATIDAVRVSGETLSFAPAVHVTGFGVGFYAFMVDATDPITTVISRDVSGTELDRRSLPDPTSLRQGATLTEGPSTTRSGIWGGQIAVNFETGEIQAPGFNRFIDEQHPKWAESARGSAEVLIGSPAEGETEVSDDDNNTIVVTVTSLGDDSVEAIRYQVRFSQGDDGLYRFADGAWSQRCQPARGHDDQFLIEPCL